MKKEIPDTGHLWRQFSAHWPGPIGILDVSCVTLSCVMQSNAERLIRFFRSLKINSVFPEGIELLYPHAHEEVMKIMEDFFGRFYSDHQSRQLLFGINPGRFGAGTTGINFTAPRQLKENLGIDHPFKPQSELSAEFIYEVIDRYGGPEKFYGDFFLTAVSPLGFIRNGKNLNYYDESVLMNTVSPFILDCIKQQLKIFRPSGRTISIGGDKNYHFLRAMNEEHGFFKEIIPLPHPRFIMQYRRKQKENYLLQYLSALDELKN